MDRPEFLDQYDEFEKMLRDRGYTQADIERLGIDALLLVKSGNNDSLAYLDALWAMANRDLN
jgi:hypothetical protein